MSSKKILFVYFGLLLLTPAIFGWSEYECKTNCTSTACSKKLIQNTCLMQCSQYPEILESCKPGSQASSLSSSSGGTRHPDMAVTPPHSLVRQSQPISPRSKGGANQPKPAVQPEEKTVFSNVDTPEVVPIQSLTADAQQFFKDFSNDFLSATVALKCLTKSITVNESYFKKSFVQNVKSKLKGKDPRYKEFSAYKDFNEYKADLGQYFESMVNLNIVEAFQQWSKRAMLAQAEFQGLITRGIRFAEGVAKKIPGYTPSDSKSSGPDMMGPYLHALPDPTLKNLRECIDDNNQNTKNAALKSFYKYFILKIDREKVDREREVKIKDSISKIGQRRK